MIRPAAKSDCPFGDRIGEFVANGLDDSSRSRFASHLPNCPRCARAVTDSLLGRDEAKTDDDPKRDRESRELRVSDRLTLEEADVLRRELERVLAIRALRCVDRTEDAGVDLVAALDLERDAAASALDLLVGARIEDSSDADELRGWIGEERELDVSYRRLRECDVLAPKPPRMPGSHDSSGRRRIVAWAASVLDDSGACR